MMKNAIEEAMLKTVAEIQELLQKSYPMQKAEGEEEQAPVMPPVAPSEEAAPEQSPEAPSEEVAPESEEGSGEDMDIESVAQELSAMKSEDIQALVELLSKELQSRQAPEAASAPEAAPAVAPDAGLKDEMAKMAREVSEMKKSIETLKTENGSLKKSLRAPVSRPAQLNGRPAGEKQVEVMEKSTRAPELMGRAEVMACLENLQKSGNKSVDRDLIWSANKASSTEDIQAVYNMAKIKGINLPNK
jgi:hypothetical protein